MIPTYIIDQLKIQTNDLNKIIQEFLDLSEIGSWRLDQRTDILVMNKKLKQLFELDEKDNCEYTMKYFLKTFLHPDDHDRIIEERKRNKDIDGTIYNYKIVTKTGTIKNVLVQSWLMDNYKLGLIYELNANEKAIT